MKEKDMIMKKYPRVTIRIPPQRFLLLKERYKGWGAVSKIVNKCLECVLTNPNCKAIKGEKV